MDKSLSDSSLLDERSYDSFATTEQAKESENELDSGSGARLAISARAQDPFCLTGCNIAASFTRTEFQPAEQRL